MLLSNYAIKFRTAVFVLTVVIIVAGMRAYRQMPREGMPDITIPFVFITAVYDGTSPAEMEQLITVPLERQLNGVENVKEMRSTSSENMTFVSIEFMAGQNIDLAKQRVKDKVDLARPDLPDDLDEPVVEAINFSSDIPVYTFALSGIDDMARLKALAESLQDQLELLPGLRAAEIGGVREREFRIEIDLTRLVAYRIPLAQVMDRIRRENRTVSAGNIEVSGNKFQVRLPGEFADVMQMREVVLDERGGHPVYLTDVATIADTHKDLSSVSRINGEPCVSINITKRTGVNTVSLIADVKRVIESHRMPAGVKTTVVMDQSDYVSSTLTELENSIFSGFVLVVAVLMVFLGKRNSFFVGLAIPLSMLMGFMLMALKGTTMNMIVLFALVMATGMLVDNAIVVVENTYRHRALGRSRLEAARIGAGEMAWPVITSTLTTVAAFSPLLAWPGIMGQFMGFLPRTLITMLAASLFVGLVINPAVCSVFIRARPREQRHHEHPFMQGYERFLRGALRHKAPVLLLGLAGLLLSALLYARFGRQAELFPTVDPRNAVVTVRLPQGASIERTDAIIRHVERCVSVHEDVRFFLASVGSSGSMEMGSSVSGTHVGSVHVEFVKAGERQGPSIDLVNRIRDQIGVVPGAEVVVKREEEGPPTGAAVSIEISGDDFGLLAELAADVRNRIATVPGLVDLEDDLEEALPELQFRIDRSRAALLGLDAETVGTFLRMAIYGLEASRFRTSEDEFDITVRLRPEQRNDLALLDRIFIPVQGRDPVPISSLGSIVYTGGRGTITHKDRKRVVTISGSDQNRGVRELLTDVRQRLADLRLPRGYQVSYTGKNKDMEESQAFLGNAFIIAVGVIAVIMVIQFNSVLLPFIILFTVALSLQGVWIGLLVTQQRFSIIMTGLGVITLAGIVVNNGIVLIDRILQLRKEGIPAVEAAVDAAKTRLRPVLLTAGTTVLGLIPMAVGWGLEIHTWPWRLVAGAESSAWWAPMAVAVIFGLTLATVLTLVLVPSMYCVADSISEHFRRHGQEED